MTMPHAVEAPALSTPRRWLRFGWLLPLVGGSVWLGLLYLVVSPDLLRWLQASGGRTLLLGLACALLFWVPGLALLDLWWPDRTLPWAERIALAGGAGLALPPLWLLGARVLGVGWGYVATWSYVALALALLVGRLLDRWQQDQRSPLPRLASWHGQMLAGLLLVAGLLSLFVVRDLPVGMWGDSYHHTMISQLLVDNGGLFSSWQPYAPLTTFTYHYGFHANAAFFHWMTGVPVTQSVIIVGQVANLSAIAGAFALASGLSGNRTAGLWAVALTAFVNIVPSYFVNWGRYTQLTGQALLPVLILSWFVVLRTRSFGVRSGLLTLLLTASLMLTHYVVTIFAVLMLAAVLVAVWLHERSWPVARQLVLRSVVLSGGALLVAAPWLFTAVQGYLTRNIAALGEPDNNAYAASVSAFTAITPLFVSVPIAVLALGGVLLALLRRHWWLLLCVVWIGLVLGATSPQLLGLPGRGVVNVPTAYMSLYVLVMPLAAYALNSLGELVANVRPWLGKGLATAGLIGASIWGVGGQQQLFAPQHMLFTPADTGAMEWIKANTAPDARFMVDMFPGYNDALFVGSDGGWWIPLLTGRQTTLPPVTYGSERAEDQDYRQRVNDVAWALRQHPLPSEAGINVLRQAGIQYIYSGAHVDPARTIDPAALRDHPTFRIVYDQDGVAIFALEER